MYALPPFSDDVFLRELKKGIRWELYVASFFSDLGFDVSSPVEEIGESYGDRFRFRGSVDLFVLGVPIEVKSRSTRFSCPTDMPWELPFVMTEHDLEEKDPAPALVICVSQPTERMVWVSCDVRDEWVLQDGFDRVRSIHERWWCAPRRLWRSIEELVDIFALYA
jgi:hypothetical protein